MYRIGAQEGDTPYLVTCINNVWGNIRYEDQIKSLAKVMEIFRSEKK